MDAATHNGIPVPAAACPHRLLPTTTGPRFATSVRAGDADVLVAGAAYADDGGRRASGVGDVVAGDATTTTIDVGADDDVPAVTAVVTTTAATRPTTIAPGVGTTAAAIDRNAAVTVPPPS